MRAAVTYTRALAGEAHPSRRVPGLKLSASRAFLTVLRGSRRRTKSADCDWLREEPVSSSHIIQILVAAVRHHTFTLLRYLLAAPAQIISLYLYSINDL